MFRKLAVILCLISFAPAAVGAQGLAAITAPTAVVATATNNAVLPGQGAILTLSSERSETILLAAADTSQSSIKGEAPEQVKAKSSFEWSNFAEVHLGGYRWIWWVGAVAALVAIHAGAD